MKRVTILFYALICFLFIANTAYPQEIRIKAVLDSSVILIGDQVRLNLQIEYPNQLEVLFPAPSDKLGEAVEIVERQTIDTLLLADNRTMLSQNYIVTSFDTGHHQIPPFYFHFRLGDLFDSVASNPVDLLVFTLPKLDSLMAAIGGPIDIKPPYEAPVTIKEVAPWLLGSILLAGLIFLILYAIKRRKNNQPIFGFSQKPKEPAHIIALRELDRIKAEKIWQKGSTKQYYSELTDTLRVYIEDRFGINAMEQTSDETIASFALRKDLLDEMTFGNMKNLLKNADLVKFAKFEPLPDDNNLAMVNAYFFVNQTKVELKQEAPTGAGNEEGEDVEIK